MGSPIKRSLRIAWRLFGTNLVSGIILLLFVSWTALVGAAWWTLIFPGCVGLLNVLIGLVDRQDRTIRVLLSGRCEEPPSTPGPNWWAP